MDPNANAAGKVQRAKAKIQNPKSETLKANYREHRGTSTPRNTTD